jgi:hypothetical protein
MAWCTPGEPSDLPIGGVAEGHATCGAEAACVARGASVSQSLADHVELQLGEGGEHVELKTRHRPRLDVEGSGYHRESNPEPIEERDEVCPVRQLSCEPVDPVDDDPLDFAPLDALDEPLEGGPLDGRSAVPFVVEVLAEGIPARPGRDSMNSMQSSRCSWQDERVMS